jgi:phosphohistidine swiveling domain-containing protein
MGDSSTASDKGIPIPVPADFPIQWEDDVEPTLLWTWDDFHAPLPRTTMSASVGQFTRSGMTQASKDTGTYRPGGQSKVVNGYPYSASTAKPMTDDEKEARARGLDSHIETVANNWDSYWLPELQSDLEEFKSVKLAEMDADTLWKTMNHALERHTRHWHIHHLVVMPVIEQSNRLEAICKEILGDGEPAAASVLLHGAETMTVRSIKEMEKLAADARSKPEVKAALTSDMSADAIRAQLGKSDAGRKWLADFDAYLYDFGYRCTGFDLSFPSWVEDNSFPFQVIRSMIEADPAETISATAREETLNAERDALLQKVRHAAKDKPELLAKFEDAYRRAQETWPLKENHSHYIDQASTAIVRIMLAEVGRRLSATGATVSADDVWYTELDEAEAALTGTAPADLQKLVAERRADRQRYSKLTPPKHIGTFPPDHDAAKQANASSETSGTLRGTAASKGEATGIARVVLSPDDFHKVRKGDVLVCRSTAPMWTPLFRVISALVSEAGGILSHPAVVAREFELPAVVGVPRATSLVVDGQPITVSGTDGLVHTG